MRSSVQHQGFGCFRGREFDQGGDVELDEAFADRFTESRSQGRADALLGGRADQALAFDFGAQVEVDGFAGAGDQLVAFIDGVEEPVDVADPEPFQCDVAEVGFEVEADVLGVGAAGALAERFASGQPGVEVVPYGYRPVQLLARADLAAHLLGIRQLLDRPDRGDDEIGDLHPGGFVVSGDGQQLPRLAQFVGGVVLGGEPATPKRRASSPGRGGRELQLVPGLALLLPAGPYGRWRWRGRHRRPAGNGRWRPGSGRGGGCSG